MRKEVQEGRKSKRTQGREGGFFANFSGGEGGFREVKTHIGLSRFHEVMGTIKWGYIQVEIG